MKRGRGGERSARKSPSLTPLTPTSPPSLPPAPADGRNVVFGRVLDGMDVVRKIGSVFTVNFKPASPVRVVAAGRIAEGSKEWAAVDAAVKKADAAKATTAAKGTAKTATGAAPAKAEAAPAKAETKAAKAKA
jgi:cyclophilin family peptidyl-prolyl cis-trans isomerase